MVQWCYFIIYIISDVIPYVYSIWNILQEIQHRIFSAGFYVIQSRQVRLQQKDAEEFYAEHEGKFFHNRLVTFMKR